MKQKPKMVLFDYCGTLLCEPGWDMLRGEKALFEHVTLNPHRYTPEELFSWEKNYFLSLQPVRDLGAEPTEIQMLRLKYELHGIKLVLANDFYQKQCRLFLGQIIDAGRLWSRGICGIMEPSSKGRGMIQILTHL